MDEEERTVHTLGEVIVTTPLWAAYFWEGGDCSRRSTLTRSPSLIIAGHSSLARTLAYTSTSSLTCRSTR